jgi:cell division septation protein DedD
MIAIREFFVEVLVDAEAGAAVADADDVLLVAMLVLEMAEEVDEAVVAVDVVELEVDEMDEVDEVDEVNEVADVELVPVTSFPRRMETNVSSLFPPKLLSGILVICKVCS